MQTITSKDAQDFTNSDNCYGKGFSFPDKPMDGALITIKGRYPATGKVMNEVCEELVYIISGSGTLSTTDSRYPFSEGDTLFIDKGEAYMWEGDCVIYAVCSPAFYPEQHKEVID